MRFPLQTASVVLAAAALAACGSVPMTARSSSPAYASSYDTDGRTVGAYDLDAITESDQRGVFVMHVDRPVEDVFEFLLTAVDVYSDDVIGVEFDDSGSETPGTRGVGSARICTFENGRTLREPLVVYEPHRFYAYTIDAERSSYSVPLRDVLMLYSFEDRGDGGTLVTVRAHFTPEIRIATPVISRVFNNSVAKTFASAADAFGGTLIDPDA